MSLLSCTTHSKWVSICYQESGTTGVSYLGGVKSCLHAFYDQNASWEGLGELPGNLSSHGEGELVRFLGPFSAPSWSGGDPGA